MAALTPIPASARIPAVAGFPQQRAFVAGVQSADINDPTRLLGLNLAILFTFIQLTKFHELLTLELHVNVYLLYIVGIPSYALLILAGGFQRTWRSPPARYWLGVVFCMFASVPTSGWIMFSFGVARDYVRIEIIALFMIAGFVLTWREVEKLMTAMALAAVVNLLAARLLQQEDMTGRFELSGGSIADPNDYAALLILMLPFLLLVVITPGRRMPFKLISFGFIGVGLYLILSTGSRGALLALIVGTAYSLWRLNMAQRLIAICAIGLVGICMLAVLPSSTTARLLTTFSDSAATDDIRESALGSKEARTYLLKTSIATAIAHPIFGVGLGQFQNYEGVSARAAGRQGNWHETHNTYTQMASEAGIPALLFLLGGMISALRLLQRTYSKARKMPPTPQNQKICRTCFAVMLSFLSFSAAIFFLSMAYRCYLPALAGIAIVVARAAEREWAAAPIEPVLPQTMPRFVPRARFA